MSISIEHPTGQTNFVIVNLPNVSLAISYQTIIGVDRHDHMGWIVRVNDWGPTTGKHLNYLDHGYKAGRVEGEAFDEMVEEMLEVV